MSGIFVSWTRANGRTEDLARRLGLQTEYIHCPSRLGLPGRYLKQLIATRHLLKRSKPSSLVLMLPPAPALFALPGALPREARFAADLHTGFFHDPKWRWAYRPGLAAIRRRGGVAVVTNKALARLCLRAGLPAIVLHDVIVEREPLPSEEHLLCPLSYANDEPVDELLKAARMTPELRWVLTGRAPRRLRQQAPSNVRFTGFIEENEYDRLLRSSAGVIALTTRPHTMQRAGYEAFSTGVPQLTSDFAELREFYADAAVYTSANASEIAKGARTLVDNRSELQRRLRRLRPIRVTEQRRALAELQDILEFVTDLPAGSRTSLD